MEGEEENQCRQKKRKKEKRTLIDGVIDLQSDGGEWHTYSGKKQRVKQSNLVKGHKTLHTGRIDGKGGA